jgi:hypothetical protein
MKFVCELFRKIQNSTKIYGICSRQSINPSNTNSSNNNMTNLDNQNKLNFSNHLFTPSFSPSLSSSKSEEDYYGAGMFIVVVICFYSLSIVFLTLFNIRFKLVFGRSFYGMCCCRESTGDHHYESQKEETKNTIHMIFQNSSKLLPAIAVANSYILTAALNEKLSTGTSLQKEEQKDEQSTLTTISSNIATSSS